MIKFDINKMRVEHVWLKSCTTALGGSISVVDEEKTFDKEVYKRIEAPLAVVRKFKEAHKTTKYFKPVLTAVTYYDNRIVALERHSHCTDIDNDGQFESFDGKMVRWTSNSESNLDHFIAEKAREQEWLCDGTFMYTVPDIDDGDQMSSDGRFWSVCVQAIKLANISDIEGLDPQSRSCLAFCAANGQHAITPPIWKTLANVGGRQLDSVADAVDTMGDLEFDRIDQFLAVNLGFALKAGRDISSVFNYDALEPLGLDELMIQLRTVNLPKIDKNIKGTFDIGMPFTHAMAWLIGLTNNATTLEEHLALRGVMKYLTSKGIYRKCAFKPKAVYRDDLGQDDVPLRTIEEAKDFNGFDQWASMSVASVQRRRRNGNDNTVVGGLYGEE